MTFPILKVSMAESLSAALADIRLPDPDGQEVRLGSLWEEKLAIIVFLRHYGCIFCRQHVAELREHEQAIRARNAGVAAIGMGDRNYARLFREETGITFPLLVDEERTAYRAAGLKRANILHLLRRNNAAARKRAWGAGHKHHTLGQNPFQLGASFVFGPGNVDRYAHLSRTFGDNASCDELLKALE